MMKYAFINKDNLCDSEGFYDPPLVPQPQNAIIIDDDDSRTGFFFVDGEWVAPEPAMKPAVVITAIIVDAAHEAQTDIATDMSAVDAPVGATLTFAVELRAGDTVLPVSKRFRMPLRSADGVATSRLIAVDFVDGKASFNVALTESRHWRVDEAAINSGLTPEEHLSFAGLDVYCLEM